MMKKKKMYPECTANPNAEFADCIRWQYRQSTVLFSCIQLYIFFSSMCSNGNVKYLSANMSLFNSPTKSGYENIIFVFDAST